MDEYGGWVPLKMLRAERKVATVTSWAEYMNSFLLGGGQFSTGRKRPDVQPSPSSTALSLHIINLLLQQGNDVEMAVWLILTYLHGDAAFPNCKLSSRN
jgi:hypothetical protein